MVSMNTTFDLVVRAFPVKIVDTRTGEEQTDTIVLDKQRLQAAQLIGESSKEIIERIYQRNGYKVLDIGKPDKLTVKMNLDRIYEELVADEKRST